MNLNRSNDNSCLRIKKKEKQEEEEEEEWLNRVTNLVAGPKKPTNSFASFFSKAFVVDSNRWMNTFSKGGGRRRIKCHLEIISSCKMCWFHEIAGQCHNLSYLC